MTHMPIYLLYLALFITQVFTGNNLDRNEPVGNIIDPPIITRFIQIRVKTWKGFPSLRAEFYGCTDGKSRCFLSMKEY